jgi:CBS-domain-containing membrane protein
MKKEVFLPRVRNALRGLLAGTLAIGLLGWLGSTLAVPMLIAPFGASCVLLFAVPESPLAQPRNLMGGHLVAATVGLVVSIFLGPGLWHAGLAVGLAIAAMELSGTVHPPAGADPLVMLLSGTTKLSFLISPILFGIALLLVIALVVGKLEGRKWPARWW